MKTYIRNIKAAWSTYKAGQWPKPNRKTRPMGIYTWIIRYTLKYIKMKLKV